MFISTALCDSRLPHQSMGSRVAYYAISDFLDSDEYGYFFQSLTNPRSILGYIRSCTILSSSISVSCGLLECCGALGSIPAHATGRAFKGGGAFKQTDVRRCGCERCAPLRGIRTARISTSFWRIVGHNRRSQGEPWRFRRISNYPTLSLANVLGARYVHRQSGMGSTGPSTAGMEVEIRDSSRSSQTSAGYQTPVSNQ